MELTHEEKILAVISHLGLFLNPIGIILALAIYLLKKEQSRFIAQHARQAVGFQVVVAIVGVIAGLSGFGLILGGLFYGPGPGIAGAFGIAIIFWFTIILVALCAVVGAYRALIGKDFQYPLVGDLINRIA